MTTSRSHRLRSVTGRSTTGHGRAYWLAGGLGLTGALAFVAAVVVTSPVPVEEAGVMPPAAPAATDTAEEEEAVTTADQPIALPLVSYELFLARDPFEPVVPEPEPEPEPVDPTDPLDPTDPAAPTDPTDPADPADPTTPGNGVANGGCVGDVEVVCDGRVLSVIEVSESNGEFVAVIQVDTMRYEVGVGDTFADVFEVVSISADQVRILFGDRVVRILVGDNALK